MKLDELVIISWSSTAATQCSCSACERGTHCCGQTCFVGSGLSVDTSGRIDIRQISARQTTDILVCRRTDGERDTAAEGGAFKVSPSGV
ncbi:hypothetical protein PoB_002800600 [Plakobranchus ocellatus]|uniref:Uncharacterized protein n=1 Tax=Plakobranchus ocellatus TaxID=259542 RepID=A0AAV4A4D4_9GAST|nr:hypothetical protein PoB_002800600 [Plakobranchus ocellatus]